MSKEVYFALGWKEVETFYTTPLGARDKNGIRDKHGGLGWSKEAVDVVDWRALDETLYNKPRMYKQWLAKQCSHFCGSQTMVAHWDAIVMGKFPNCKKPETASHLNLCGDAEHTRLFIDMTDTLDKWLVDNYTHLSLLYWIPKYITNCGRPDSWVI